MDAITDDLVRIAKRCERTASLLNQEALSTVRQKVDEAINAVAQASSQVWIGYHANVYTSDLRNQARREVRHSLGPGTKSIQFYGRELAGISRSMG